MKNDENEFFEKILFNKKPLYETELQEKSTSKIIEEPNEPTKMSNAKKPNHHLFHLLKEHLTCEMYDAFIKMIETHHWILKIFLGIFLLAANALNAYMTIGLILTYLQYDVISTSRTFYETPSKFPMVTICNQNPFTTLNGLSFVNEFFDASIMVNTSYLFKSYYVAGVEMGLMSNIWKLNDLYKKSISHSLDEVLIGCKFNYKPCTSADFIWIFDKNYGNCYSFNTGFNSSGQEVDLKVSNLAGSAYGLQLDFYVNYHQNLTSFNSLWGGLGAIIRIDNVTNVIDHVRDGILAAGGSFTNIALGRENKFIMKKPYSDCVLDNDEATSFNSDIYNAIIISKFSYGRQFCLIQCIQKYIIKMCGCSSPVFESVFNESRCSNVTVINNCVGPAFFVSEDENFMTNNCLPLCPLECNSTKFTYDVSATKLVGDPYVDIIQNNANLAQDFVTQEINADTVSASVAKVNVFYDSLSYVNTEELPALDIITLIANMGGTWGLFLSLNFFSIAELMTTLIELFYYNREKNVKINK